MQKGVLTIKQASIDIDGKTYKTTPVRITVTNAVEQPRDPNEMPQVSADDVLHLVADVSKTNPYLNEPITAVYKLYFGYNVQIDSWQELNKPKYNDFWSQNIDIKQLQVEEGQYKGERYRYVVLRKTVLYPQKSGKLNIEPLSLDINCELPTNRRNFWGQVLLTQDHKRVSAGANTIMVKPLPEAGKPAGFSGAVGHFTFSATPSKTTLRSGESLDLNVSVSGTGNLKLFDLPKPVVPAALEMYDPVHKENVSTPLSGMTGKISDTYTLIPQFRGKYPIKPMSFTYFDLGSKSYKTITSPEIMVNVLDGPMAENGGAASAAEPQKVRVSGGGQFEFIALKTSLSPMRQPEFFGSGGFYAMMLLPLLCIPLVIAFRRKKQAKDNDVAGNRIRMSGKLAKKYLSDARQQIGNKEQFYIALEKAMHNFLKAKLSIETSEMTKEKIRGILAEKAAPQTVDDFISLMESCEFARYAPSSDASMQHDLARAESAISELEKQL
jgi:hypothetical protein